jgi:ATP-dependent Lhr-like helicase
MSDTTSIENIYNKLDEKIKAMLKKEGIVKFTEIQKLSFDKIYNGSNVLLISPTGSGKTIAAMLPIYQKWLNEKPNPISILYITPMKSLNRDLLLHLESWAKELEMEIAVRHGDTPNYERKQQSEFPDDMLILTLEMLQSILIGKKIRENLKNVKWVVLDEVHEIFNSKRGVQLSVALERLKQLCRDFQLIMLSATVSEPEKVANFFSGGKHVEIIESRENKRMEINVIYPNPFIGDKKIAEMAFVSKDVAARLRTIIDYVKKSKSTLIFTNTRDFAEILTSRIKSIDKKLPIEIHHSSLSRDVRINAEKEFKNQKIKGLICTSSLELGVDIGSVDLVLQYMSPRRVIHALQRIGRSGHKLTEISKGIIIATNVDDIFESAVIAKKALNKELEKDQYYEKPYDVLAHQIIGLTFDFGSIELEKAFEIVKKAYPYKNLNYSEFLEVCKQLERLGLVFLNGYIKKRTRGFKYYFEQLSTIPSIKQFKIFNTVDNSFVGMLDEEFVALHGEPNTTFIVKGQPWRIISVENDKVLVEPSNDTEATIPGWEGELIPVSFEVAEEVGRTRRYILELLEKRSEREVLEELMNRYPIDENCAREMIDIIKKQKKFWIVPDENNLLIEDYENIIIIHACFGTNVNETLGIFLTALLSSRIGTVGLKTDPYRIILQTQENALDLVKEILTKTNPEHLKSYIEISLSKSELFEWKFIHVAKRFGAIARDAEFGKVTIKKIIEEYVGSPVYKETLKELEVEKLDIERATDLLRKIQNGEISIHIQHGLSPLGSIGIKEKYSELISPEKPEKEMFEIFKNRLLNTKVKLICMNCGEWEQTFVVKNISDKTRCRKCDSIMLAVSKNISVNHTKFVKNGINGNLKNETEIKRFKLFKKKADIFMTYRRLAAIALAAKGVGPTFALRILSKYHKDENELFKDILEAERNFVRTKRYWSV